MMMAVLAALAAVARVDVAAAASVTTRTGTIITAVVFIITAPVVVATIFMITGSPRRDLVRGAGRGPCDGGRGNGKWHRVLAIVVVHRHILRCAAAAAAAAAESRVLPIFGHHAHDFGAPTARRVIAARQSVPEPAARPIVVAGIGCPIPGRATHPPPPITVGIHLPPAVVAAAAAATRRAHTGDRGQKLGRAPGHGCHPSRSGQVFVHTLRRLPLAGADTEQSPDDFAQRLWPREQRRGVVPTAPNPVQQTDESPTLAVPGTGRILKRNATRT
jgi:hypothetical protein